MTNLIRIVYICLTLIVFCSCKSKKAVYANTVKTEYSNKNKASKTVTNAIVNTALSYQGIPYKYGGTTKRGMDCSGLIYTAFKNQQVYIPRVSSNMAKAGFSIPTKHVLKGDLLFFRTSKKRGGINHVGLVVNTNSNTIEFIHSTTSRGVIISSLREPYWKNAFIEARRVL